MRKQVMWGCVGAAALVVAGGLAVLQSRAADDDADVKATVEKMADSLASNDESAAKKAAGSLPKDLDPGDVMGLLELRKPNGKGGLGVGSKGTVRPAIDGVEKLIQELAKKAPGKSMLQKQGDALKRAAYISAASAEAIHDHSPVKAPEGKKSPEDWKKWSAAMRSESLDLAKAIDSQEPQQVKSAASKLNDTCVQCHNVFKE